MVNYGYCITSISAVRFEPSERAEMVSQLFFGEIFIVLEDTVKWVYIRNENDGYTGWLERRQYAPMSEQAYAAAKGSAYAFPKNILSTLTHDSSQKSIRIFHGTPLPFNINEEVEINNSIWRLDGDFFYKPSVPNAEKIIAMAKEYLNAPYLWGGKSIFGCDCSGFVQTIFNMNGITIKRDAFLQARDGEIVNLIDEALPGDLIFFDNLEGQIIHVGIFMGNGQIIHASGYVKIDAIDHLGIFNADLQTYTHKLRVIKRYF
ncbi:MAG: C40 family peptidase [Bacteroidales bacterium]|jgi:cell wall-associated NlpC family hydrolase|nr:C40 family peptidase [Bacteroidales bacterium]